MFVKWKSIVALLLALTFTVIPLASCKSQGDTDETDETAASTSGLPGTTELPTDSETEIPPVDPPVPDALYKGPHADMILHAHGLANVPQIWFENQSVAFIRNQQALVTYPMNPHDRHVLTYANKDGVPYVSDTMDVFIEMANGNRYYSSNSLTPALSNTYRLGYYYYENRFEGQNFIADDVRILASADIDMRHPTAVHSCNPPRKAGDNVKVTIGSPDDPWIALPTDYQSTDFNYVYITMRTNAEAAEKGDSEIFVQSDDIGSFTPELSYRFHIVADNEFHTYIIPLAMNQKYTGHISQLRIDFLGNRGDTFEIQSVKAVNLDSQGAPTHATLQRTFATYADKMHQIFQISTDEAIGQVKTVGFLTEIPVSAVNGILIGSHDGIHHDLNGIDWDSVKYVGFDMKNAGIFGYILPIEQGGRIEVTQDHDTYVIQQTVSPAGQTLKPSEKDTGNQNDLFFGNRVYTDMSHNFDAFIQAAEQERHPLTGDQFTVHVPDYQPDAHFGGYDALRGAYILRLSGPGSFNPPYYQYPNHHFPAEFTVNSPDDRTFYVVAATNSGCLESAVLLNKDRMTLPIPIEVCKNFNGDGENTIYNLDDASYGEAIIPMTVKAQRAETFTMVHLYQNFGRFPLKQISSIQYFKSYYHLSTGVTETNCIVPFEKTGPRLPDHRAMSAPLWGNQPQHTSGGLHGFLSYTTKKNESYTTDNTSQFIGNYGPTYADITLGNRTEDGAIDVSYRHLEMPQTDENRAYYEMRYTVNQELSFRDFAHKFSFYSVTDNDATGDYRQIGYLNEKNESCVAPNELTPKNSIDYILGRQCPYFSMFDMKNPSGNGYVNLSFLIYDSHFVINGQTVTPSFILINTDNTLRLSLNLDQVELKPGDTFTINAIIMPWGSQNTDYSTDAPDRHVREVRENTLLHPLTPKAEADCTVMDSVFLPELRTSNGQSAEFTLSGGANHVAVRIYGFNKLTVPSVMEKIDGQWVEYPLSSLKTPDRSGYAHNYDGYSVVYDGDGTFSYSFVVDMGQDGQARTFRITADKDFTGWGEADQIPEEEEKVDLNLHFNATTIQSIFLECGNVAGAELGDNREYVRVFGNGKDSEAYMDMFRNIDKIPTGQYIVLKFRAPEKSGNRCTSFEFFLSTLANEAAAGHSVFAELTGFDDGQWHVIVIDVSAEKHAGFRPDAKGQYISNYFRFDIFNKLTRQGDYVDIAYIGMSDSLEKIYRLNQDMDRISLVHNGKQVTDFNPKTGAEIKN